MKSGIRLVLAVAALALAAASIVIAWQVARTLDAAFGTTGEPRGEVRATGAPLVMRTPGGLLEVATLRVDEHFTRRDTRRLLGLSLGENVVELRVPVTYRFHIELEREWPVTVVGTRAIVRAPEPAPSLPVAFDTAAATRAVRSGWARFDSDDSLAALERSVTAELAERAGSPRYRALVREDARRTIAEFATRWLLTEQRLRREPGWSVTVVFDGEPADPATAQP